MVKTHIHALVNTRGSVKHIQLLNDGYLYSQMFRNRHKLYTLLLYIHRKVNKVESIRYYNISNGS